MADVCPTCERALVQKEPDKSTYYCYLCREVYRKENGKLVNVFKRS